MGKMWRRAGYWLRQRKQAEELAEEMAFHRAELDRSGAGRAMGNATLAREDARAVWIAPWIESLWQDAAYGVRSLASQPGLVAVALIALGSAIGLNTTLFTLFNGLALRPWPVHDAGRVVNFWRVTGDGVYGFGPAEYRYLAEHAKSASGLILYDNGERVKLGERPLQATYVSGNYFQTLGVQMVQGRGFLAAEDVAGSPQAVVVLSEALWRSQFDGAGDIVGRAIPLDGVAFTVVGVVTAEFSGTSPLRNDLWVPLASKLLLRPHDPGARAFLTSPGNCCISLAGRLADGVSKAGAQAELAVLSNQFQKQNHLEERHDRLIATGTAWMAGPSKKQNVTPVLALLFTAVTLVLLLACANVGNLLLARASARQQEIAIRLSLGGSRGRVIRQLLVESSLLAGAAAGLGLWMAYALPPVLLRQLGNDLTFNVTPDLRVLGYTMALATVACLAFGLAPALHGTRANIAGALRADARQRLARLPLRTVLLAVQVAVSVILLAGAGLLLRGLQRTQAQDPGYDAQNVSLVALDLPANEYGGTRTKALARELVAQLEGVESMPAAGVSMDAPLGNSRTATSMTFGTRKRQRIIVHEVSGGYFAALGIPIVAGRNFTAEDAEKPVIILNEAAVRRYFAGENPIGQTALYGDSDPMTVVGVVRDAYLSDMSPVQPAMFWPMSGRFSSPWVLVRGTGPEVTQRVTAVLKQVAPRAQVRVSRLAENLERQMQPSRIGVAVAGALGLLALGLASVGMAGVFAYMVGQRTREIGVRMALGARPEQVVRLVLLSSLRALAFGIPAGLAGAVAMSILLERTFPGVRASDPAAYVGMLVLLAIAAGLATAVPARRAARIDPVRALRWE